MSTRFIGPLLMSTLLVVGNTAMADYVGGVSYIHLADDDIDDFSLGLVAATIGYQFESGSNFTVTPELRAGVGVKDDTISDFGFKLDVEAKHFYGVNLRGQWAISDSLYLYVAPSYSNLKIRVKESSGFSMTDDSWEFGGGGGLGFGFSDRISAEVSYEYFDGTDVISAGLRFQF